MAQLRVRGCLPPYSEQNYSYSYGTTCICARKIIAADPSNPGRADHTRGQGLGSELSAGG